jgi:uncharacterized protein (DUF433 family)
MAEIVSTDDTLGGAPRIEGRRIGVHHVVGRVIDGDVTPAQVAADYDLAIADVYRALTYYYDHPDEIREIRKRQTTPPDGMRVVRGPEDFARRETPEREV